MSADRLGRELRIGTGTRLGTVISPVWVRSRFFLGIDRERKTPTQILLRGASILPVGAPRTWGIARVLFALGGMARMSQQVHERGFSETLLSIDLAR